MRSGLLSELENIGYEIHLEGDNIRYRYQKPGNPPDKVKLLIDELKKYKAEIVKILKMGSTITPAEKSLPQSNAKDSWPPDFEALINWFMIQEAPIEPFLLEPHIRVVDPAKFYESLQREIKTGPRGPRARMGTLQWDLQKLKAYLN